MIGRIATILFCVSAIVFSLSYISRSDILAVSDVTVEGAVAVDPDSVKQKVKEELAGNFFGLFSRANVALFPKSIIKEKILSEFPRIKEIAIRREGLSAVAVLLEERTPFGVWCSEEASKNCFLLDEEGLIFDTASSEQGKGYLVFYGTVKGDPIRQYYLPGRFTEIIQFLFGVKTTGLVPKSLSVKDENDAELRLENGEKLLFALNQNFSELLENLETVYREAGLSDTGKRIDYIDLRFGNKIFYKKK